MRKTLAVLLCLCLVWMAGGGLAQSENLLTNPGFEEGRDGKIAGWTESSWQTSPGMTYWAQSEDGFSGQYAAMVENVVSNDARFGQTVSVTPGSVYKLSGVIKAENCDPEKGGANLSVEKCFGDFPTLYDTKGEWVDVTCYVRPADHMQEITVMARVGMYQIDTVGKAWFDDLSLTLVDSVPNDETVIDLIDPFYNVPDEPVPEPEVEKNFGDIGPWLFLFTALLLVLLWARARKFRAPAGLIFPLLIIAALVRLYLMLTQPGYATDMNCFLSWALRIAEMGPSNFYAADYFCDYPPGYMYPLWITGLLLKAFDVSSLSMAGRMLVKLMPLLFDLAGVFLLYRFAMKRLSSKPALLLAALYALSPAVLVTGAAWGQVDSVLALGLLLATVWALDGKWHFALPVYAATILMKPQALVAAPIALAVLFRTAFAKDKEVSPAAFWRSVLIGLAAALAACAALLLPFLVHQQSPLAWIVERYTQSLGGYNYATVNATNLFYLMGANWKPLDDLIGPITYGALGTALTVIAFALPVLLYLWRGSKEKLPLFIALAYITLYLLGVKMHERYVFPALLLLLVAYVTTPDRRVLLLFVGFSVTMFVNCALVLQNLHLPGGHDPVTTLLSFANLVLFCLAVRVATDQTPRPLAVPATPERLPHSRLDALEGRTPPLPKSGAKALLLLALLTGAYAVSAFVGLGDTTAPQTEWRSTGAAETVTFDLGEVRTFRLLYYASISGSNFTLTYSEDGVTWTEGVEASLTAGDCFKWQYAPQATARYCRIAPLSPSAALCEVAFQGLEGELWPAQILAWEGAHAENGVHPASLLDEQQYVPDAPSYMNGMYFDEIYHGRTAYEMLHKMPVYEWTHPPLGKILIMLGIQLFGMTPFGWRFSGTLIGVLMVPAMYFLGLVVFKKPRWALFSAFLMAADMMHLAQTRIATIDSYAVFFTILMYACMLRYLQMSFFRDGFWRTLVPLFFSALFMGLGWAAKWTCFYAAVGLAALFFWSLIRRFAEYREALRAGVKPRKEVTRFWQYLVGTVLFCLGAFIAMPAAIYYLSYIPHFAANGGVTLKLIADTQKSIFNYHAGLVDNHPFKSPWYEWPLILKPIWYYNGQYMPVGWVSSIMSTGNPAIWWVGCGTMLWTLYDWIKRKVQGARGGDARAAALLISFAAQFVPWMLVPRSMFIYHYFGSLPFVMLSIVCCAQTLCEKYPEKMRVGLPVYVGVTAFLFVAFYPIATGIPVPRLWLDAINLLGYLRLPGWQWQRWLCY